MTQDRTHDHLLWRRRLTGSPVVLPGIPGTQSAGIKVGRASIHGQMSQANVLVQS